MKKLTKNNKDNEKNNIPRIKISIVIIQMLSFTFSACSRLV